MPSRSLLSEVAIGLAAGAAATIPMSWSMELLHRLLPRQQQHALPPRKITERLTKAVGLRQHLSDEQRMWLSLAAHVGYGAAVGAIYAATHKSVPANALAKGTAYGGAVWAGSYLGLLPAVGLLSNAAKHPARRNAVMITTHAVFGTALAIFVDLLESGSGGEHPGFLGGGNARPTPRRHEQHA
jgi:putative membrane protein